ncbi:MAG: hypothetical protein JJT94_14570 [Bernardetiaceae bacterium]|nr:hypothetical protein [Bernardetiaceae bacterium]
MELTEQEISIVSKYIMGQASHDETNLINEQINKNRDFAEAVAQYEQVYFLLQEKDEIELFADLGLDMQAVNKDSVFKKRVSELRSQINKIQQHSNQKNMFFFNSLKFAAVIILLFVASGIYFIIQQSRENLYEIAQQEQSNSIPTMTNPEIRQLKHAVAADLKDSNSKDTIEEKARQQIKAQSQDSNLSDIKEQESMRKKEEVNKTSDLLAFTEVAHLEALINSKYRGGLTKITQKPNLLHSYNKDLEFEWQQNQAEQLTLHIHNYKDTKNNLPHLQIDLPIDQDKFILKEDFKNGLYYWKITDKEGIVGAGKFIVGKMPK